MKKVIFILMAETVGMFLFGIYEVATGQFVHGISIMLGMIISFILAFDWIRMDAEIKRFTKKS